MSDLISRSKVIAVLEKLEEHSISGKMDISNAIYLIDSHPTAYDIDKVVEELKETMQDLSVIEILSHIDFDSTIQSGLDNFLKAYNSELLRIVKQGGVSDDK